MSDLDRACFLFAVGRGQQWNSCLSVLSPISVREVLATTLVPKKRKRSRKRRRKLVPPKQPRTLLLRFSIIELCFSIFLKHSLMG